MGKQQDLVQELASWSDHMEAAIVRAGVRCVQRVIVVAKTGSTQDLGAALAGMNPGLLVLAGKQTSARGRLGRVWTDFDGHGLAATFVLDAGKYDKPGLPIAVGLAVCRVVEAALGHHGQGHAAPPQAGQGHAGPIRVGLRWPNDVVERRDDGTPGRKVAGILIERRDRLLLVGVGMNVLQDEENWGSELSARAVSLAQLGSVWSRLQVAERLLVELDVTLNLPADDVARAWGDRDLLRHRHCAWLCDGRKYEGRVVDIAPTSHIEIKLDSGESMRLPAMWSSLVSIDGVAHGSASAPASREA